MNMTAFPNDQIADRRHRGFASLVNEGRDWQHDIPVRLVLHLRKLARSGTRLHASLVGVHCTLIPEVREGSLSPTGHSMIKQLANSERLMMHSNLDSPSWALWRRKSGGICPFHSIAFTHTVVYSACYVGTSFNFCSPSINLVLFSVRTPDSSLNADERSMSLKVA